jgi:hypothetical protein
MLEHWLQLQGLGCKNWFGKFDGIPFSALGPIEKAIKVQHLLVTWAD